MRRGVSGRGVDADNVGRPAPCRRIPVLEHQLRLGGTGTVLVMIGRGQRFVAAAAAVTAHG